MNTPNSFCNNLLMSDIPSTDMPPLQGLGCFVGTIVLQTCRPYRAGGLFGHDVLQTLSSYRSYDCSGGKAKCL